jgi:hypothetical protein
MVRVGVPHGGLEQESEKAIPRSQKLDGAVANAVYAAGYVSARAS